MFSVIVGPGLIWSIYDASLDIVVGQFNDPDDAWNVIDSLPDDAEGRLAIYDSIRNQQK